MENRYNHHNRRKYSLKVHIVLVTKYRKQILKGSIADDVKQKIYDNLQYERIWHCCYGNRQRPYPFSNKLRYNRQGV